MKVVLNKNKIKIISMCFALGMAMLSFPVAIFAQPLPKEAIQATTAVALAQNYYGGTGENSTPYLISSCEEYAKFVADGVTEKKFFQLIKSIDLTGTNVQTKALFKGTFDGNGLEIKGISRPLFNEINGGTVKNLSISGNIQNIERSCGSLANTVNNSIISNILSTTVLIGNETGLYSIGGVIDSCTDSNLSNIIFAGSISGSGIHQAGGIVGKFNNTETIIKTINNCFNYGKISSNYNGVSVRIGGIVGHLETNSKQTKILLCGNEGNISAQNIGNGAVDGGDVVGCAVGGIVGSAGSWGGRKEDYISVNIDQCYNIGNIYAGFDDYTKGGEKFPGSDFSYAGGIVGCAAKETKVTNCYNKGYVQAQATTAITRYVLGKDTDDVIVCQENNKPIKYHTDDPTTPLVEPSWWEYEYAKNYASLNYRKKLAYSGGIVGYCYNNTGDVSYCYNTGSISGGFEKVTSLDGYQIKYTSLKEGTIEEKTEKPGGFYYNFIGQGFNYTLNVEFMYSKFFNKGIVGGNSLGSQGFNYTNCWTSKMITEDYPLVFNVYSNNDACTYELSGYNNTGDNMYIYYPLVRKKGETIGPFYANYDLNGLGNLYPFEGSITDPKPIIRSVQYKRNGDVNLKIGKTEDVGEITARPINPPLSAPYYFDFDKNSWFKFFGGAVYNIFLPGSLWAPQNFWNTPLKSYFGTYGEEAYEFSPSNPNYSLTGLDAISDRLLYDFYFQSANVEHLLHNKIPSVVGYGLGPRDNNFDPYYPVFGLNTTSSCLNLYPEDKSKSEYEFKFKLGAQVDWQVGSDYINTVWRSDYKTFTFKLFPEINICTDEEIKAKFKKTDTTGTTEDWKDNWAVDTNNKINGGFPYLKAMRW
ncbi:MAG: ZmpA/ZmpB/ZmpC family metallo-endopeptidase-related protein [Clostridia bacterium]